LVTEYATPVALWQGLLLPVIAEGCAGTLFTVTASVLAVPSPHVFDGVTETFPALAPTVTLIEFVPWPAVIDQPEGRAQVYVTPDTLVTEYVTPVALWQGLLLPVIVPGCEGSELTVTANVLAVPLPHVFDGVTETFPALAPTVTLIEFVPWPAVIDQPDGRVQVYVTPDTLVTEYGTPVALWHGLLLPVIATGWAGTVFTVTANVLAVPSPHVFDGVTETFPALAPTVTLIEFVPWPAVIDQSPCICYSRYIGH
jgi:hypothetical protein